MHTSNPALREESKGQTAVGSTLTRSHKQTMHTYRKTHWGLYRCAGVQATMLSLPCPLGSKFLCCNCPHFYNCLCITTRNDLAESLNVIHCCSTTLYWRWWKNSWGVWGRKMRSGLLQVCDGDQRLDAQSGPFQKCPECVWGQTQMDSWCLSGAKSLTPPHTQTHKHTCPIPHPPPGNAPRHSHFFRQRAEATCTSKSNLVILNQNDTH